MQILTITDYDQDRSLYKPKNQSPGLVRQESFSSSSEGFEAVAPEAPPSLALDLELAGIGISLINRKMIEVVYITIDTLKFQYTNSAIAHAVNLSCGILQIDNQLHDAIYPVILQPTPIVKELSSVAALPTVQLSVIWLNDQGGMVLLFSSCLTFFHVAHGVFFIKYFSILLQALTIEADEDLLFALYDLTQVKGVSWEEGAEE
jgi:vacuolar protein sorting-associated protein 13A/C